MKRRLRAGSSLHRVVGDASLDLRESPRAGEAGLEFGRQIPLVSHARQEVVIRVRERDAAQGDGPVEGPYRIWGFVIDGVGHVTTVYAGRRSGWVTFAGVLASIAGVYNLLSGVAAIADDARLAQYPGLADIDEVLFGFDLSTWGWFWAIIGGLQLVTAILIFNRNVAGQILGLVFASISAMFTVFVMWVYPMWGLVVMALDLLIIYALSAHGEEFE